MRELVHRYAEVFGVGYAAAEGTMAQSMCLATRYVRTAVLDRAAEVVE